ncbi:MAG: hypothetical protein IKD04_08250 [Clostridia bacterium]|nr:hypothetical protein [Clostridia bacterium]
MKKLISLKLTALLLVMIMLLSACKGGGGGSTGGKSENPSAQLNIKSLSEITTATDPEYADALVAETELYSDGLVHTGNVKYTEKEELPDISKKFPEEKYKNYSYKDFEHYIGDGFKRSGYSSVNADYKPYTAVESKVFQIDFEKDFEVKSVTIKWSGSNAIKGRVQFSDDTYSWYNAGEQFVLTKKKNEITVETNETHRRYMRLYFPTSIKIEQISDVTVNACPSNPTTKIPDGAVVNNVATPTIYPIATSVEGVKNPVISLAGTWKFCAEPQANFWENDADLSEWHDVPVPGDPDNLHLGIRTIKNNSLDENYPTAYKLRTTIPKDYAGNEIILQLDGVQYYSRIFVNGELVRVHRNGTTTFSCLITDYVEAGKDAIITIEATTEIIQGESSLYQGITGYPRLMAVPKESISRLQYEVDLDKSYTNATLDVSASAFASADKINGKVKIELTDPDGKPVELKNNTAGFKGICEATVISNEIKGVQLYSDEHPNLYTLTAYMLDKDGKVTETLVKKVGFKEIEVSGNKVLVNGKETKLRGVNWINLSPEKGLVADYWSDRESLIKLKAANVNYIRTAHHPQFSYVFDICDELGIYVEQECALAMICQWNSNVYEAYEKICNPNESDWYHNYYAEMVEMARSNASLLFYSLGNESSWEINIETGAAYIKKVDTKHLTKFSWGYFQPAKTSTDIFSEHYPTKASIYNMSTTEVPYVYDEYAHVYGHVPSSYYEDPSLALHWGLEELWDLVYYQDGGLGGAIWNGRDWVTLTPTGTEKYFSRYWGILDTWNREREEYWVTKKAYSPIQIDEEKVYNVPSGDILEFEVENRYRHTNLKDIKLECTVNGKAVEVTMPSVDIAKKGKIQIKYSGWKAGDIVKLVFRDDTGKLENYIVDEYEFTLGGRKAPEFAAVSKEAAPAIADDGTKITVTGTDFSIEFDKTTGKVTDGKYKGTTAIVGGPELNLGRQVTLSKWKLSSITSKTEGTEAVITVKGDYAQVSGVTFNIRIDATGRIDTQFNANLPGGEKIEEMGVTYTIKEAKELNWSSDVFNYSVYPQASVGRLSGTALAHRATEKVLSILEKPTWYKYMNTTTLGVEDDGTNYTDDFRARRHNVFYEQVTTNDDVVITFESTGKGCAKITSTGDKDKNMNFILGVEWGHYTTAGEVCCNYDNPPSKIKGDYSGNIVIRLGGEKY